VIEITALFNKISITIVSIITTKTINNIWAKCIKLKLFYKVIKKEKKKVKKGSMKNMRKGGATVIASSSNISSTSY